MSSPTPRVSIGMPVFNGANYIREAIDSILGQTYEDFDLIVSDNASTDDTEAIVRAYAARDGRVRYYRNATNVGAAANMNRVFALGAGEYFRWAAHDDVLAPQCLARCVEMLDRDAGVVLCQARALVIDEQSRVVEEYAPPLRMDSPRPRERFLDMIVVSHRCYQVFGVIRRSALERTPLHGGYPASDRVLLARLALLGRFYELPEPLFRPRAHAAQPARARADRYALTAWYDPAKQGRILFPKWRIFAGYWSTVVGAPVPITDRLACYGYLVRWLAHNRRELLRNLTTAAKMLLLRSAVVRNAVIAYKGR